MKIGTKNASKTPLVKLDPAHPATLSNKPANIPQPLYYLEKLLAARSSEYVEEDPDDEDVAIFEAIDVQIQSQPLPKALDGVPPQKAKNDWKHNAKWVKDSIEHLMPPPLDSTPSATMAVQRELRAMLKEQEGARSLAELGWYMPPELVGDNLFQWIVELHSFDKELPISKDMKSKCVPTLSASFRN